MKNTAKTTVTFITSLISAHAASTSSYYYWYYYFSQNADRREANA